MGPYLKLFRSVRFNILLLAVIAVASAIGTLLPQASETPEKVEQWLANYPVWGKLFEGLGFFRLYESWWYLALLALMAFDIVVCKLASAPPDAGLVSLPPELQPEAAGKELDRAEAAIAGKPLQAEFILEAPPEAVIKRLRGMLSREHYHMHKTSAVSDGGRRSFVATRHRVQRWGSYLSHVALVVILAGGLLKQLYGFVEMVPVLEGGSRAMQYKPDWELKVEDFTVLYYDGTKTPKHFSSELKVYEGDKLLGSKLITVNDPLDVGGIRFYQASWGAGGMFKSVTLKLGKKILQIPQRSPTPIPGTKVRVVADLMLPDFTIGPGGQAENGSLDYRNPAVKLRFIIDGEQTRSLWLFLQNPNMALAEGEGGVLEQAPPPPFKLAEIDPVYFSGIQVAYDPGYPVVLGGGIAWLIGMILLFYMHRRRLWVVIGPADGPERTTVRVGAWSSRGERDFKKEFETLMRRLGRQVSPSGKAGEEGPQSVLSGRPNGT